MADDGPERSGERRQSERARAVGTAIVLTLDRYVGTFLLENVSADGALLAGVSLLSVGDDVRVLLQVHGSPRIGVLGRIARRAERDGQHLFALTFRATPAVQIALERAALGMVASSSPFTLVVEENADTCAALTCELQRMGRSALGVHTPIEAIGWLHAPGLSIETIAVGLDFADMNGLDLLDFIALDFPTIRRVPELCERSAAELARVSVHSVLREPWGPGALYGSFSLEAP
jgi:hypothetical protein